MREIKLLAYVNNPIHGKGVFPVKSIHFDPFVCEIVMGDEIVNFFDFDDIALLEYTGLKDKNGKEIYEGDIVKFHFPNPYNTVVKFKNGHFAFYKGKRMMVDPYYYTNHVWSYAEVIGNIYEHPHLLGSEEK
jgi:uncharacterized phage protein (TIGR01671 family)